MSAMVLVACFKETFALSTMMLRSVRTTSSSLKVSCFSKDGGYQDEEYWPERTHQAWSIEDDTLLWEARDTDLIEVAQVLKRGIGGCISRLKKLQDPETSAYEQLFVKGGRKSSDDATNKLAKTVSLRPFNECLERIHWDYTLNSKDFTVGYRDRFLKGYQEIPWDAPNKSVNGEERSLIAALPEHRIEYIKYKRRLVWHKELRLDRIFGSGRSTQKNSEDEYGPQRIQDVIRTYDEWKSSHNRRGNQAIDRAITCLGSSGKESLASFKKLCQSLTMGDLEPEEFVTISFSADFFGPDGWGHETLEMPSSADERSHDTWNSSPFIQLLSTMPEEHAAVLEQVYAVVASRNAKAKVPGASSSDS